MTEVTQFVGKNILKTYNTSLFEIISLFLKMSDEQQSMLLEKARYLSDRRKKARIPCMIDATFYINGEPYNGFLLDVNGSGALIDTDRGYPIGHTLKIEYFDPFCDRPRKYVAEIVWSGSYAVGIKFMENF
jgi:hypothetical protein